MKKQFLILAAIFIIVAFISYTIEKVEMSEMTSAITDEIATGSSTNRYYGDPLTIGNQGSQEPDFYLTRVSDTNTLIIVY